VTLRTALVAAAVAGAAAAPAAAQTTPSDRWLPSTDGATWVYGWSNSAYSPKQTVERYRLDERDGASFRLRWTTEGEEQVEGAQRSAGIVDYRHAESGLVNLNWSSTAAPSNYPVLCAAAADCGNSLAGAHFLLIWGTRSPVIQEPLLRGSIWSTIGGQNKDVSSLNRYAGRERVVVPAFPRGVLAAKVESEVAQAGAIGDPFGSGVRTVWWVYGVGPVRVVLKHTSGETSQADLLSTSLQPRTMPSDVNLLPLTRGTTMRFRYRNTKHLKRPSVQEVTVAENVNNTARLDVKHVSGPIRLAGSYFLSSRAAGIVNLQGQSRAATSATFPALGPRGAPADRRLTFYTPLDLMTYGFNPVLRVNPPKGATWTSRRGSRDFTVYGVSGRSTVLGYETVATPRGRVRALRVRTTLRQAGFRYGSGVRDSWFAPDRGLVKLVLRHDDGSTSIVDRLR
jgi:hypothetical protein